jgi:exonuclease III
VVIIGGPAGKVDADTARFEWIGADPDGNLAGFCYSLDDSATSVWTESSSVTLRALSLGVHEFYVQAADDSGARSLSAVRVFERAYEGGVGPHGTDSTLDIATWNVQNFPKHGEQTLGALLSLIPRLDLDIYTLQEVEDTIAFRRLLAGLPEFDGLFSQDDYGSTYQKTAVVFRRDAVSVSDVHQLFWSSDSVVRPPLEMRVTTAVRGRPFTFNLVVLHAKAGTSQQDFAQRRALFRLLKEHFDVEWGTGDSVFVAAGDWNDMLDDPAGENAFQLFLDDSTRYRFLTLPLAGNSYHGSYIGGDLIDHLLVTRPALSAYGAGVTQTLRLDDEMPDYKELVSDHRPVMATFALP